MSSLKGVAWGQPRLIEALRGVAVAKLSLGESHGVAITTLGQICTWGHKEWIYRQPVEAAMTAKVKKSKNDDSISNNNNPTQTAATASIIIQTLPRQPRQQYLPSLVNKHVIDATCAGDHTFVITDGPSYIGMKWGRALWEGCEAWKKRKVEMWRWTQDDDASYFE
eukprot:CAMPEP_0172510710 /NCGR_PEP_ID=MMETSP1066-20121228/230766_1 /TAXON_ID=671091 /ORGANISM="Coscinodiscus wailesii, Strain CCMP2513" /LENGTH=165 /DNA_ID=CAMNT_0013289803 /DNA_START=26 /DNA_END=520 /DNA_ORIENTATION=-